MNKLCPRCRCSQPSLAAYCADCGHQFRSVAPLDQTQFAMGPRSARRQIKPVAFFWIAPLAIVIGLLFVTNPTRAEFISWITSRTLAAMPKNTPPEVGAIFASGIAAWQMNNQTTEQNFFVGSLYTVHSPGIEPFRVLGVAKQFIPLDSLPLDRPPQPAPLIVEPPQPTAVSPTPAPSVTVTPPEWNPPRRLPPGEYQGINGRERRVPALPDTGGGFGGSQPHPAPYRGYY